MSQEIKPVKITGDQEKAILKMFIEKAKAGVDQEQIKEELQETIKSNTLKMPKIYSICRYIDHKTQKESVRANLEPVIDKICPQYMKNFDNDKIKVGNILKKCVNVADQMALSDAEWATKDAELIPETTKEAEVASSQQPGTTLNEVLNGSKQVLSCRALNVFEDAQKAWKNVDFGNWFEKTVDVLTSVYDGIVCYSSFSDVEQKLQIFLGENYGIAAAIAPKEQIEARARHLVKKQQFDLPEFLDKVYKLLLSCHKTLLKVAPKPQEEEQPTAKSGLMNKLKSKFRKRTNKEEK